VIRRLAEGGGGKGDGLARLIAAGLPVPRGFIVAPGAGDAEVLAAAAALRAPLVVRSSSALEDQAGGGAPGVFLSVRDVTPATLLAAVRDVRLSAETPPARAYLAHQRLPSAEMFVIVQEQIPGALGTLYTRTPDDPASPVMWAESEGASVLLRRDGGDPRVALGLSAERSLGVPADVEYVRDATGQIHVVQARPIRFTERRDDEIVRAARDLDPGKLWTWDAAHNPDPLSPAQAGLVALVADLGGSEPAILAGYLYTTPRPQPVTLSAETLRDAFTRLAEGWRATLAAARGQGLAAALAAYRAIYAEYAGPWGASLAAARRQHRTELSRLGARVPRGAFPTQWDVVAPARALPFRVLRHPGNLAEEIAALSEEDDEIFAEMQALVADALSTLGAAHGLSLEEIAHLPLGEVTGDIAAARRERARRARLTPPLRLLAGRALDPPSSLRGVGASPGRARGTIGKDVLVAPTLVPGTYPDAIGAVAIVLEHGGILSHGAALARELGIPCVVGCRGARDLVVGEKVWVDGDLGVVVVIGAG
jgi:phosphohistidine swiveling domain-containing protein